MTLRLRSPETCPHRAETDEGGEAAGGCRLAGRIVSGANGHSPAVPVGRGACEACCRTPEPSDARWNAVVASLVVRAVGPLPPDGRARAVVDRAVALLERAGPYDPVANPKGPAPAPRPAPVPHSGGGSGFAFDPTRLPRVGLVGPDDATGLGSLCRDLVAHAAVVRWLTPARPGAGGHRPRACGCRVEAAGPAVGAASLRAWARGLDWVVFAEEPVFPGLVWRAREMGAAVACVPMWEWTHPDDEWLRGVDLMVCPTVHAFEHLLAWKRAYGFAWELTHVPWPVDLARFAYRPRGVCRRFVFVNGRGGCTGRRADGSQTPYRRKGLDLVLDAARLLPGVPFLVHSQVPMPDDLPPNVEARPAADRNDRLYDEGDVCVQPSRWEGIGLSLLECQAAGLPLVTTDAPPMNEFAPFRAVPAASVETVYLQSDRPVTAHLVTPERLAETLGALVGTDVSAASREARAFVERFHGWQRAARLLREALSRRPVCR